MSRAPRVAALALLAVVALVSGPEANAAPPPRVYSVIEGRDAATDQPTVVLIGRRVSSYRTWAFQFPDGSDAGAPERAYKSRAMVVFRLPAGLPAGAYRLVLSYGRRNPVSHTHAVEITHGGVLPGSLIATDLDTALMSDLVDAETLGGEGPSFYRNASNLDGGTLATAYFSAYEDLESEARLGSASGQVAAGDHRHDADYATRGELGDAGTLNDAANPIEWTKLKNVPTDLLDGSGHTHDGRYYRETELNSAGTLNDASNPVDWTRLKGVPDDFADGTDADTTYSAGTNVLLNGTTFDVPSIPWMDVTGRPSGLDDGDDDTTYSAGKNVTQKGTAFEVPTFPWADLSDVPADIADGDDDTTYKAGAHVTLTGSEFSVPSFPWTRLTGVPAGLDDGDDDTTYKAGAHVTLTGNEFSVPSFPWTGLTGIPAGIADGDDDTTYTAGSGLALTGTQFSVSGVPWTGLTGVPAGFADGTDDGGPWSTSGSNVYRSTGRVGIGTSRPDAALHVDGIDGALFVGTLDSGTIPTSGAGTRLMWYPKKAAFRAGHVGRVAANATNWDDKNVGQYSTALGVDTKASGQYSIALGLNPTASAPAASAFGSSTTASGNTSTAMGSSTTASGYISTAMGASTAASGYASTAMGSSTTASGDNSTTMGVATTAQPWASVAIGRHNTLAGNARAWIPSDPVFIVGNGSTATSRSDAFTVFKDAGLLAGGQFETNAANRSIPASGVGTRMMWYPEKAAFRAGRVLAGTPTHWDNASVGVHSTAFGAGTKASGDSSTAMGQSSRASGLASTAAGFFATASGDHSTAMGYYSAASGDYSTAIGPSNTASGKSSTAMGVRATAQAFGSLVIGRYNAVGGSSDSWVSTDPVLVVGKGSSDTNRSNSFFLRKNGDLTIAGALTENSDARLKKDIAALHGVLPKIAGIRGVTYRFKDDKGPAGSHVGLLAQEVRDAFPELVSEGDDGTLSVAYGKFTAVLLEAVKEQQKTIEKRSAEVQRLRKQLQGLDARLRRLEDR